MSVYYRNHDSASESLQNIQKLQLLLNETSGLQLRKDASRPLSLKHHPDNALNGNT
jgi:hypothetical protein